MCGTDKKGGFETNNSLGEERASRGSKKSELWFCIMKKFKFKLWSPSNLGPSSDSVTSVILAWSPWTPVFFLVKWGENSSSVLNEVMCIKCLAGWVAAPLVAVISHCSGDLCSTVVYLVQPQWRVSSSCLLWNSFPFFFSCPGEGLVLLLLGHCVLWGLEFQATSLLLHRAY